MYPKKAINIMSSTLCFRKTPKPTEGELGHLKQPLKGIFARRFYDHDGSLGGGILTLSVSDLPWLQGVSDAFSGDHADRFLLLKILETIEGGDTVDMWFEV